MFHPLAINKLISFSLVSKRCLTKSHCNTDSKAGVSSPTTSCSTCRIEICDGIRS